MSYQNFASAASDTVSIPAHLNGDLLVLIAFNSAAATAPSTPAGWTNIAGNSPGKGARMAFRVSDGTVSTVTATNATAVAVWVYRSPDATPIGTSNFNTWSGRTTWSVLGHTLDDTDGSSSRLSFGLMEATGITATPGSSLVQRDRFEAGGYTYIAFDAAGVTSAPSDAMVIAPPGTNNHRSASVEVRLTPSSGITADSLLFTTQPVTTQVGSVMPAFAVSVVDSTASNAVDTTNTDNVTLSDAASNYSGTKTRAAVAGVATFNDIVPLKILTGTTLTAEHATFADEVSATFNVTTPPTGTATPSEAEPPMSLVLRDATDADKRQVFMLVENTDGTAWTGSVTGVKPTINGTPIAADIVRVLGKLHRAQLSQPESDSSAAQVPVLVAPSGATGYGIAVFTPNDWTVEADSTGDITQSTFRAMHYLDGYGVRRAAGDTQFEAVIPGEPDPVPVVIDTDTSRPTIIGAGAGAS